MDAVKEISYEVRLAHHSSATRRTSHPEDIDEHDPPPEKPDCSEMTEEDAFDAMKDWKKQCKAWTDHHARRCRGNMSSLGIGGFMTYSGDTCPILWLIQLFNNIVLLLEIHFTSRKHCQCILLRRQILEEWKFKLFVVTSFSCWLLVLNFMSRQASVSVRDGLSLLLLSVKEIG
jgi:hypothetical protein